MITLKYDDMMRHGPYEKSILIVILLERWGISLAYHSDVQHHFRQFVLMHWFQDPPLAMGHDVGVIMTTIAGQIW